MSSGGTVYHVKEFIVHEFYQANIYANDIGLIRVQKPIKFNDRVQPITLSPDAVPENSKLVVTGWGRLGVNIIAVY